MQVSAIFITIQIVPLPPRSKISSFVPSSVAKSPVCVGPGWKPRHTFFRATARLLKKKQRNSPPRVLI